MKTKFLTFLLLIAISACNSSNAQEIKPIFISPSTTPSPIATFIPTNTSAPTAAPTPTLPPYTYEPLSIVFLRDGNLWIANIGERTVERQLTFEPSEISITSYAISPDENRIAYIPYQVETLNSLIKLVHIDTGEIETILGENDPYNEIRVFWLDNTKIAYKNQGLVPAFVTPNIEEVITYIIYDLTRKKQVAITEHKSISQSPNGRYWLTCVGFFVCKYTLHDLPNGKQSKIEANINWGGFIGWSHDSKFMLFNTRESEADDCTSQLVLINTETLQEKMITPEDKDAWEGSFSPSGEYLIYNQANIIDFNICKSESENYWLMNMTDYQTHMIPVDFDKDTWDIHWTPDGKRLIFFYDSYGGREGKTLWSMNIDGSDLEPILANVMGFRDFKIITTRP